MTFGALLTSAAVLFVFGLATLIRSETVIGTVIGFFVMASSSLPFNLAKAIALRSLDRDIGK